MDVAAWLRGLGLGQYAPAFRENDIDGDVLPELTADDLISIAAPPSGPQAACCHCRQASRSPQRVRYLLRCSLQRSELSGGS